MLSHVMAMHAGNALPISGTALPLPVPVIGSAIQCIQAPLRFDVCAPCKRPCVCDIPRVRAQAGAWGSHTVVLHCKTSHECSHPLRTGAS
eukprot:scaffold87_cov388-Prasinococcus_capsulatus_cf.AAC.18